MHSLNTANRPRIAITMGDVNGVGPEVLAKALTHDELYSLCQPVVFGAPEFLHEASRFTPHKSAFVEIADLAERGNQSGAFVYRAQEKTPACVPGSVQEDAGRAAVAWIRAAVQAALDGHVDAVVTCPVNKEGLKAAGCHAIGHTEIVAEMTQAQEYRMSLFTERMAIVHVSGHEPLARALALVKTARVLTTVRIAHDALVRLDLPRRRIAVAGLNPHAGEGGLLGDEEVREILPAIELARSEGIDCSGPHPPDTVFRRMSLGEFDLVVAMYHDQGHIPLKLIAMDEGVNVTLGVPIVRTSVDHGTAYDIAWQGKASETSLLSAVRMAVRFTGSKRARIR